MIRASDVSILFLLKPDSFIRIENFFFVLDYVRSNFDFKVHVYYISSNSYCFFENHLGSDVCFEHIIEFDDIFHRTKYVNLFLHRSDSRFVGVWDVDVVVPVGQIIESLGKLHQFDLVFPYSDYFFELSFICRDIFLDTGDFQFLKKNSNLFKPLFGTEPVGGLFFLNRESYISLGGENERMYGWGPEDLSRVNRFKNAGSDIFRVSGPLFHLTHPKSLNSRTSSAIFEFMNDYEI